MPTLLLLRRRKRVLLGVLLGSSVGLLLMGVLWWRMQPIVVRPTTGLVYDLAFSPDSHRLVIAAQDGLQVYQLPNGRLLQTIHTHPTHRVAVHPDGTILGVEIDGMTIKVWNVSDDQLLTTVTAMTAPVTSVAISSDQQMIAFSSAGKPLQVWRITDRHLVRTLPGHTGTVRSIAFSPDGQLLAAGGSANTVTVWRVHDGQQLAALQEEVPDVYSVAFSPDGHLLGTSGVGVSAKVIVWRVADWHVQTTLSGHPTYALGIAFSPRGHLLASASGSPGNFLERVPADPTIRLWRIPEGTPLKIIRAHRDDIHTIVFSPDGRWLASGSRDRTIKVWRMP